MDRLVQQFPKDYRAYLFRGLYLYYFSRVDKKYYQQALQEFQKALALNSRSPLPYYYIGDLYTRSSLWTDAAWASDDVKFDDVRKAAQQYTKAIEVDSRFLPAYESRAESYLELKQSHPAIRDYDKILESRSSGMGE